MSYSYAIAKQGMRFSELTESERAYISERWQALCERQNINNSEVVFVQRPNGNFIEAYRGRINAVRGVGSMGGYWRVRFGNCKKWGFEKTPLGSYEPEALVKYFAAIQTQVGEVISIPKEVHTKKEVLELIQRICWEI